MEIKLIESIRIEDIVKGFNENQETDQVVGFGGKLNIRPEYQRAFVYNDKDEEAVINTVISGYPLNVMYWAKTGMDTWEVMDGQQRTISICKFINDEFSVDINGKPRIFSNLEDDIKEKILNYKLSIYGCVGKPSEILEWFKVINIAGKPLTPQELRNAAYHGPWVSDAKRYFSKIPTPAVDYAKGFISGSPKRQDILEIAIDWARINSDVKSIDLYMASHQQEQNAMDLWTNYCEIIDWAESVFDQKKDLTDKQNWGMLFKKFHLNKYDKEELNSEVNKLIMDDEITNNKGIYEYLLSNKEDERPLSLRTFTKSQMQKAYEMQKGICPLCNKHFEIDQMQGDHKKPWADGGKTTDENCQMLCIKDNQKKSNKFNG